MKLLSLMFLGLALVLSGCSKKSAAPQNQATLDELNRIVSTLNTSGGGRLADTNQVASFLAAQGKTFPVPPAGKRLLLNPATHLFEFAVQ